MTFTVALVLQFVGLLVLATRMRSRVRANVAPTASLKRWPRVSVIVPARNEEANLPALLTSLAALAYPDVEIIVVDDQSEDRTAEVARSFGARLVPGRERPPGWGGKAWACQQGGEVATGEVLLFTDADTVHAPDSLRRAVSSMAAGGSGMLSALPWHASASLWEKLTGPFQVLLLALTAPYDRPRPGRVYAIGQYLLFTRKAYEAMGGHAAVKECMVEDLPMANRALRLGIGYEVLAGEPLYDVRMYGSVPEFVRGWRRNFRAGFAYSSPWAGATGVLLVAALIGGGQPALSSLALLMTLGAWVFTAWRASELGRFPVVLAPLAVPFSLGLFCFVTMLALYDQVFRRPLKWKGRAYEAAVSPIV